MPTNYNGNLTGIIARQLVTIAEPNGTDPRNAASVATPLETLANFAQWLMQNTAILNAAGINTDGLRIAPAADGTPALEFTTAALDGMYRLLLEFPINASSGFFGRLYQHSYGGGGIGGLSFTMNARWTGAGFVSDNTGPAAQYSFVDSGYSVIRRPATDPVGVNTAITFQDRSYLTPDGYLAMPSTGTLPASNTPFANTLTRQNLCKAWGVMRLGPSPALLSGFNIASAVKGASVDGRIGFAQPFIGSAGAADDYCVVGNVDYYSSATNVYRFVPYGRTASELAFVVSDASGGPVDVWTSGTPWSSVRIHFQVFGRN